MRREIKGLEEHGHSPEQNPKMPTRTSADEPVQTEPKGQVALAYEDDDGMATHDGTHDDRYVRPRISVVEFSYKQP